MQRPDGRAGPTAGECSPMLTRGKAQTGARVWVCDALGWEGECFYFLTDYESRSSARSWVEIGWRGLAGEGVKFVSRAWGKDEIRGYPCSSRIA